MIFCLNLDSEYEILMIHLWIWNHYLETDINKEREGRKNGREEISNQEKKERNETIRPNGMHFLEMSVDYIGNYIIF